jgi:hypothetical protein
MQHKDGIRAPACYMMAAYTMMPRAKLKSCAVLAAALAAATTVFAQENDALLGALIRKGILTTEEAEDIRLDLVRERSAAPVQAVAGGKSTERLSIGMRMQLQYAHLDTDVSGAAFDPAATNHAFLRRIYFLVKARLPGNWAASMTYDFAASAYDEANLEWRPSSDLTFNFGLRKVNVAYEERATSGHLKSIERSGVTRYFVEHNNGRRLGAASYRVGVFLDGSKKVTDAVGFVYGAAVTNPERNDTFSLATSSGNGTNNKPALWANAGLTGRIADGGSWIAGAGIGHLPDQGGVGVANLGRGSDLTIYSIYADITAGRFGFMGEYLTAAIDHGASPSRDAMPAGFFLQPSFLVTETVEAVIRYQHLDTDGRGVQLADVVRSAPNAPTMDKFEGWFAGANWYLRGNDLKYQLGVAYGKTSDTVTGAPAEAKTVGVRSQMQMQF